MIYKNLFPGGKPKALTFSYDDATAQDLRLLGILKRYGMTGTFNINSGRVYHTLPGKKVSKNRVLSPEEIRTVYQGFEVAIHGYSHPFLQQIPKDMIPFEIAGDRHELEKIVGYPVRGMAYPFGAYSDSLIEQLRQLGIVYARVCHSTEDFNLPKEFLAWQPTCHHNCKRLDELADKFINMNNINGLKVFYVWGHTYEFDTDNNWDVIEKFCEKMAFKDDIWYATNIEIYDYVQALDRLVTSCDGNLLYNPSAVDVWVSKDQSLWEPGEKICVPAGKVVNCG